MLARIYQPAKTAMQSGRAMTRQWVLDYEPGEAKRHDALMGWTGSGDMLGQVRLTFATREEAVAYAQRHDIPYQVQEAGQCQVRPKAYADNFATARRQPWSH